MERTSSNGRNGADGGHPRRAPPDSMAAAGGYHGNAASIDVLRWLDSLGSISVPVQARSLATLRRIVDHAIDLFLDKGFEATTIADIAEASATSTGAIYSRFADKTALLLTVIDAYYRDRLHIFDAFFARFAEPEATAWDKVLDAYIRLMIDMFRFDAGMIRLIERVRQDNDVVAERTSRLNHDLADRLHAALRGTDIRQGDDLVYRVRYFHTLFRNGMALCILHDGSPSGAQIAIDDPGFEAESFRIGRAFFA